MLKKGRSKQFKVRPVAMLLLAISSIWWIFCLPDPLFDHPMSTVVFDRNGQLLSASIAEDEQWRMPASDSLTAKIAQAVVGYEDRRFYSHWGVDFRGLTRAIQQNWQAGRVVSGGSTISMQVIRMARGNRARTFWNKLVETLMAWRLEWSYTKAEILNLWATHAPFGGNVVGVEAASWRYYGRAPTDLSWAEASTLAVLPNSPGLIHPGRSRDLLLQKRNRLLDYLGSTGHLDSLSTQLAKEEPLPDAPLPLPRLAPHLLNRLKQINGPNRYTSSVDGKLQQQFAQLLLNHHQTLAENQIHNLALQVVDVASGQTLVYLGNVPQLDEVHSPAVDLIQAARSPGSLLKPMLYGLALEEGLITPSQFLVDVPVTFGQFSPANFSENFSGAVPADLALSRSLNVPFVLLLREYGIAKMHAHAKSFGFNFINKPADHYGLSLVLGGCEVSLEQISSWFLGLARQQRYYYERQGQYAPNDWKIPTLLVDQFRDPLLDLDPRPGPIGAGAGHQIIQALQNLERPNESGDWEKLNPDLRIAWKTGTSFGYRDAWAVGASHEYVVAVWAGNADGEGRPSLVGVQAAAPLLFQVFRALEHSRTYFETPFDEMESATVCAATGYLPGPFCHELDSCLIPANGLRAPSCPYHQQIFTDASGQFRTQLGCASPDQVIPKSWLVLPPNQAHFFQRNHATYLPIPPWSISCQNSENNNLTYAQASRPMQLIYPNSTGRITLGRDWRGQMIPTVFEVAHQVPETTIYWHLDEHYMGSTQQFHSFELKPLPGKHQLTLVDENGHRFSYAFEVVGE
ncbi:MAG: penicillin-binding protein 1C [Bacteroidota bacterium]